MPPTDILDPQYDTSSLTCFDAGVALESRQSKAAANGPIRDRVLAISLPTTLRGTKHRHPILQKTTAKKGKDFFLKLTKKKKRQLQQ